MNYIIDFDIKNNNSSILDKVISDVRSKLGNIKETGLINKCDYVTKLLCLELDKYKIDYNICETHKLISNDVIGHMFLIVYIEDKSYIVDLTYLQFFLKDKCNKDMYKEKDGITYIAPDPGYYYVENNDKINIAKDILENGYIELDNNNLKSYLDSFFKTRRGRRIDYDISASTYMNVIDKVNRRKM